jgi:hypothetical protein
MQQAQSLGICYLMIWISCQGFGFGYVGIINLREEKLIYLLPNPNLFVRFLQISNPNQIQTS